jgi:RhoGAP domain
LDSVNLDHDEWSSDINNVASVIKQWLRNLPDPLLTFALHQDFIDAASEYFSFGAILLTMQVAGQKSKMIG